MEVARFVEAICGKGDCLHLRPQQRVPLPPAGKVLVLREGMLAIDAMPTKGKLQVLDFLVAGDVVSASTVLPTPGVSLRAITSASLVSLDPPAVDRTVPAHDYWTFLMSRTDIANYLVINCDTLSRTMMRFCDCGLIERESRHAIRVIDLDALRKRSPLAALLSAVFEKGGCRQEISSGRCAERKASMPLVHENLCVIPPVVTTGPISRSSAERRYASRGVW